MIEPPILEILPEHLRSDASGQPGQGWIAASAVISATMLFGNDRARWDAWRVGAAALKRREYLAAMDPEKVVPLEAAAICEFGDSMNAAGAMEAIARQRLADCDFAGNVLRDWLWPRMATNECAALGLPVAIDRTQLTLPDARRRHARNVAMGKRRSREAALGRRTSIEGDSTLLKRWERARAVAHLALAHRIFKANFARMETEVWALPCALDQLRNYLLFAEKLRRAALAHELPRAETLWQIGADVVDEIEDEALGFLKSEWRDHSIAGRTAVFEDRQTYMSELRKPR